MTDDQKLHRQLREEVKARAEVAHDYNDFEPFIIRTRKLIDHQPVLVGHNRKGDLIAIIDGIHYIITQSAFARAAVAFHNQQHDEDYEN